MAGDIFKSMLKRWTFKKKSTW